MFICRQLPDTALKAFEDLLTDSSCLLVGDLNARSRRWGCPDEDNHGKQISEIDEERGLVSLGNGHATHPHHNGSTSVIDLAFATPNIALDCSHAVQSDLMHSNHMPILITMEWAATGDASAPAKMEAREG